jgi:hypothetical protein
MKELLRVCEDGVCIASTVSRVTIRRARRMSGPPL